MHGAAALMLARDLYKTPAVVTQLAGELPSECGVWGCGKGRDGGPPSVATKTLTHTHTPSSLPPAVALNRATYASALRLLLLETGSHRVALFEPAPGGTWRKTRDGSPGRLAAFEADLYRNADASDAPPLLAVALPPSTATGGGGVRQVGACLLDAAGRTLAATQFGDDAGYGALEALASAAGVREAVLAEGGGGDADVARARAALERAGALVTPTPRPAFAVKDLEADLGRLLRSRSVEQHRDVLDRPLAAAALAGALSAAEVAADPASTHAWALTLHNPAGALRLDAAAAAALGVADGRPGADPAAAALVRHMNVARTPGGRRLLPAWLRAPLVDPAALARRHDAVGALSADAPLRDALRSSLLRGLPDIDRAARRLERKAATLADLCALYRVSSRLATLEAALRDCDAEGAGVLVEWLADPLARERAPDALAKFESLIEAAIDLDRVPDEYLVRAEYDDGLATARVAKDEAEAGVDAAAAAAAKDLGLTLDKGAKLEWFKPGGGASSAAGTRVRCLRVTATEERRVRSRLSGGGAYTLLETRKDGTKFTCGPLRRAADVLAAADAVVAARQADLAAQVVAVAASFCDVWGRVGTLVAELDVLTAFAHVGASAPTPWVRPTMTPSDGTSLILVDARHPVVEAVAGVDFVPNSVEMKKGESWFEIVTGPNMGGKSTFIRSIGVAVLLAQAGAFVPASSATLPLRDAIFARVGAGDCQARGVSTFMAEMLETAAILRGASSSSLVIVDELGRGTSTYDGLGLAAAIGEHLLSVTRCPVLFATHFHELTGLQGPTGVANLHVVTAADAGGGGSGGLTMLHRVAPGPCDESFGIACAEAARLPPSVIAAARAKAAALKAGEPGAKRPRVERALGAAAAEARAHAFLAAFAALPPGEGRAARAKELVAGLTADAAELPELKACLPVWERATETHTRTLFSSA